MNEISTRVLLESMVRADATIDTGDLYAVGNALGMTDQQVRLCIRRAVTEGQFTQEGRGRRALLRASAALRKTLDPDVEFVRYAYEQDGGHAPWDGRWHLVAFAIPESLRPARDAMRDGIVRLGGAPIQGGLYVSANPWEPHVTTLVAELDVAQYVSQLTTTDLTVGEHTAPQQIAARLWPLDDIAARHHRLLELSRTCDAALRDHLPGTERVRIGIELAIEFTRAMEPDPLLAPELLPQPWIGATARAAFAHCWARLSALADATAPALFTRYHDTLAGRP
ncbi:PaaX family transcriptional regulator C-terminal domain-containing protein [Mycobacterium aquaticum]|uniref:Transcriptional regulator n=1 Tax=Mycobacterium aquaticum TaxID=1927124 RepID=A0A1X0A6K5_9MYCO|nr:PaaX family transcriptional regulator C-terminal domain-containing protein [Mycobacterium aquaticum]ORA25720.1 transcriptional regulator [Mycobacterium aquaticum]